MINTALRYALIAGLLILTNARAEGLKRLDIPLPKNETCLIRLGTGPEMRVPPQIARGGSCSNGQKATPIDRFAIDIQYPEMTVGVWSSAMNRIFGQISGKDIIRADDFPVRLVYVFYPEQFKNPSLDNWSGPNPQVWQMRARKIEDSKMYHKDFEPIIYESKVKGLRKVSYAPISSVAPSTPGGAYDQADGVLIEPFGADYELLMTCDAKIECEGYVQLKVSHVQYRFLMPTEAVNHASDVIAALNRMLGLWIDAASPVERRDTK